MRVLLAVDGSACSDMAVQTVIDRFRPDETQVKVLHAVEWMREMPLCFQYSSWADGRTRCGGVPQQELRACAGAGRAGCRAARVQGISSERVDARCGSAPCHRRGRPRVARRSHCDRIAREARARPPAHRQCRRVGGAPRAMLGRRRPDAGGCRRPRGTTIAACHVAVQRSRRSADWQIGDWQFAHRR